MKQCTRSMKSPSAWRLGFALVFAIVAQGAQAVCVQTSQQLADALSNPDFFLPLTIQLAQGTYNTSGGGPLPANTSLLGGYTQDCVSRNIASGNTVLTGALGFWPYGNLTLQGLTFDGGVLGLDAASSFYTGSQILISRSTFTGAPLSVDWFQAYDEDVGGLRIVDSLFVGNTSNYECVINFSVSRGYATFDMTNNTVMNNPNTTLGGVCLRNDTVFFALGVLLAHDNIFYGNGGVDLYSDSPNLELVDNTIGTSQFPPPIVSPVGTKTGDPKLDANYRPIEVPLSPSINSGESDTGNLPATDLDGGPRVVGSKVDRGAYESNINDTFLLSVTNANDSGAGSLREAIINANVSSAFNIINFAIGSGCGPHVITLASPLPPITSTMYINGYSQPGAAENDADVGDSATLCVVLDGATNNIADGLLVPASADANTQLLLHGLAFGGFTHGAVTLYGGKAHTVLGNRIGGVVGGVALQPSGTGVIVGSGVSNTAVGGVDPANRNIVGDAIGDGIVISGSTGNSAAAHDNQIVNNLVGAGWNSFNSNYVNRGNGVKGIHVAGYGNTISGNVIGFNGNDGIDLDGGVASGNTVEDNLIGMGRDSPYNLANGSMGVRVENGAHNNKILSNTISDNAGTGVRIVSGQGNSIRKNSIYTNGSFGIDLAGGGVTPNDDDGALQVVDYANRGQNFPVITSASGSPTGGIVTGTLTTLPGNYTIDFYMGSCDAAGGYGEGKFWLRSKVVTTSPLMQGDQATANFSISLPPVTSLNDGTVITATATDSLGNTSEFSACSAYVNDVIFADGFQ